MSNLLPHSSQPDTLQKSAVGKGGRVSSVLQLPIGLRVEWRSEEVKESARAAQKGVIITLALEPPGGQRLELWPLLSGDKQFWGLPTGPWAWDAYSLADHLCLSLHSY